MEKLNINEFTIGNSIEGFYTLKIKEISDEISDVLTNMEETHKLYDYYKSVLDYNIFSGTHGVFLNPREFNKNMDLFKYQQVYNLTKYGRIDIKERIYMKDMDLLEKVNDYVSLCICVHYRTELTYCFCCKKKMMKASMRRHEKSMRHAHYANKLL
jgi:hypothetical protein